MDDRPDRRDQPGATTILYRSGAQQTYYFDADDLERLLRDWRASLLGDGPGEPLRSYSVVFGDHYRAGQLVVDVTQIAAVQTIDVTETKRRVASHPAAAGPQAPKINVVVDGRVLQSAVRTDPVNLLLDEPAAPPASSRSSATASPDTPGMLEPFTENQIAAIRQIIRDEIGADRARRNVPMRVTLLPDPPFLRTTAPHDGSSGTQMTQTSQSAETAPPDQSGSHSER